MTEETDQLLFWGTGDAMGVPRLYCKCPVCEEARNTRQNRRYRSAVYIKGRDGEFLIDCGPDFRSQMERAGKTFMQDVVITHAHFDHIGGLPEWADACRWLSKTGNLYAPQEVIDLILRQYPWLERNVAFTALSSDGFMLAGWNIQGWKVNHGKNGYSYAYRLSKPGFTWVYCSDSIALTDEQKKPLHGLDLLVLGTSFYKEDAEFAGRSVYDMTEALDLLREVKPGRTLFTHMSHDIDMRKDYRLPGNVEIAAVGGKTGTVSLIRS